jgi:hypothetical protein
MHRPFTLAILFGLLYAQLAFANPPPAAMQAGYEHLAFEDRMFSQDNWTDNVYNLSNASFGTRTAPIPGETHGVRLTNIKSGFRIASTPSIWTATTEHSFLFGYVEARMRFTPGANGAIENTWGTVFLISEQFLQDFNQVTTASWCELDIFEPAKHNKGDFTQHSWTYNGALIGVDNTSNSIQPLLSDPIDGRWHKFGMLWSPVVVTWYYDDRAVLTVPTYPVCQTQPAAIILGAGSQLTPPDNQITDVDYVQVWQ